jgi:hypothetical protein
MDGKLFFLRCRLHRYQELLRPVPQWVFVQLLRLFSSRSQTIIRRYLAIADECADINLSPGKTIFQQQDLGMTFQRNDHDDDRG